MQNLKKQPVTLCLLLHGDNSHPADSLNAFNLWVRKELALYSVSRGYDYNNVGCPCFHLAIVLPEQQPAGFFSRSWELFSKERGLNVGTGGERYLTYRRLWIDSLEPDHGSDIPDDVSGGRF